jgi:hypothetical protein
LLFRVLRRDRYSFCLFVRPKAEDRGKGHERRSAAFLNVLGAVGLIAGAMPGSGSAFAQDKNKQVCFPSWGGKP